MIYFLTYIIKLLINLFVTTILVTDVNKPDNDNDNIKYMFFISFLSLTLISIGSFLEYDNSFFYGSTIIALFYINSILSSDFSKDDRIKMYLISLCSILFGFGKFALTLMGFVSGLVSYIILYNSTDFYRLFFSNNNDKIITSDNEEVK